MKVERACTKQVPSNPDVPPPRRTSVLLCFVMQTTWTICIYHDEQSKSANPSKQDVEWGTKANLSSEEIDIRHPL